MDIEEKLSDVLSEFARTLGTDFPIQAILDHLVEWIVHVLPITSAGVTLISPGENPHYVAASSDAAMRYEQLQTELDQGPCLAAYRTGEPVAIPDLRVDGQFPWFAKCALAAGLVAVFTFPLRHGDGRLGALDLYREAAGGLDEEAMSAAQTLADVAAAYLINAQARSDLAESADQAREISLHDSLTGLANRTLLIERIDHAIVRSRGIIAVMFADIDEFKSVNDTYGHHVGDELLVAVADRLTGLLRPADTLARLSGDEFAILCEDLDDTRAVESLAIRIDESFGEAFVLPSAEVRVNASVGIAYAGSEAADSERILQIADTAMYQAKRKGGARHTVLDLRDPAVAGHRTSLHNALSCAASRNEFRTDYQPIIATADRRITGAEALLRWTNPQHGNVPPAIVIPMAENGGLIDQIGCWVLEQACTDRHRWLHSGTTEQIGISVNVSAHQLMTVGFAASVADVLSATATGPNQVTLEVTESVFVQDSARALVVLSDLKQLGVMLALDDFGTGYSSLSYLLHFPFDVVKIDRVFIAGLNSMPASRVIIKAAVGIAHDLNMTVIAEGVETRDQYEQLAELGCDACQGYYVSRPIPTDALEALLAESSVSDLSTR